MVKNLPLFFIPVLLLLVLAGCEQKATFDVESQIALGTVCSIKLPSTVDKEIFSNCFKVLSDVEKEISKTRSDSYVSILNREKKVTVNKEVFALFEKAISLAQESGGKLNIAMGEVIELWDIGGINPRIPTEKELQSVNIDFNQIKLDKELLTVEIPDNMKIDLGALGKGYAGDKVKEYLKSEGVEKAIINLGGNVLVIGEKEKDTPWTIGLQDPANEEKIFCTVKVKDTSIVTSGTYERFFFKDGVKYHHLLNPDTLYPHNSDIISSTIIGENSLICDSLSTACYLLDSEKALDFMNSFEDYVGFFLLKDKTIVYTKNFNLEYEVFDN